MSLLEKSYPLEYPDNLINVINAMSFTQKIEIIGSANLRSQLFTGDIDIKEVIKSNKSIKAFSEELTLKFQKMIKNLINMQDVFIGDIKLGDIKEWQIINDDTLINDNRVINYNQKESLEKLNKLSLLKVVNNIQYNEIEKLLKFQITTDDLIELKELCKFHIIRWKPSEILEGYKILPDKTIYTLVNAFESKATDKLDVVYWFNNRYIEMSINYYFYSKNKLINKMDNLEESLKQNIYALYREGRYFKMAKRIFSLLKIKIDRPLIKKLTTLFNSDLGRIYQIIGDIGTIDYLLENKTHLSKIKIHYEIEQFKYRLSNVSVSKYMAERFRIIDLIDDAVKTNDKYKINTDLDKIEKHLSEILNYYTVEYLKNIKLIPVSKNFLP
jgi:hypothetical protein